MAKVEAYLERKIAAGKNNGCTLDTVSVRREWYVLLFPHISLCYRSDY
jgi:hypothetical protein